MEEDTVIHMSQLTPYEHIEYSSEVLDMLAQQVKGTTFEVFRFIWNNRSRGCTKAEIASQSKISRRKYDDAILVLEAARFIFAEEDGRSIRYFPTVRGRQLSVYLKSMREE